MKIVSLVVLIMLAVGSVAWAESSEESKPSMQVKPGSEPVGENAVNSLGSFRENWILSELRSIRADMMSYKNEMNLLVTDRELEVADKAMGYATSTVTYFFYLIAGAASMLALVGWTTIRDLKDNIRVYAEREMSRLTEEYESRLADLEKEVRHKSQTIEANQEEIERTNEVHALWLKASKEPQPEGKIALYDKILEIRPDDLEAVSWKADAALELGEQRWALSLCNKVLEIDERDSHALYQRACANAALGDYEKSLDDLTLALSINENLKDHAQHEEWFKVMKNNDRFVALLGAE